MQFHHKIYATIFVSFFLLLLSLTFSYNTLRENSSLLRYLNQDQIQLSTLTNELNYTLKKNQALILQHIVLHDQNLTQDVQNNLQEIDTIVDTINSYVKVHPNLPQAFLHAFETIQHRVQAYKLIENSVFAALHEQDAEDLQDALLGFNSVTDKFSFDTQAMMQVASTMLYEQTNALFVNNTKSSYLLIASFVIAFFLISFAIYKFMQLHKKLKGQLQKVQEAEEKLQEAQKKLLEYNENLEKQVAQKTQELYTKIYTHPISHLANRNKLLEDAFNYNFRQMALLNIDKFQSFNDVYGENIGNIALRLTAEFLQQYTQDYPVLLYHIGGDEFVIVCIADDQKDHQVFIDFIDKLLKAYQKHTFVYEDYTFQFMMSAGLTFTGKNKMLAYADMALKDAKKKNIQLSIFHEDKSLEKKYQNDLLCLKKLTTALQNKKVFSLFQPIVPIQNTQLPTKYESLVRLEDENGEIIAPFNFLDVAKANRIYYKVTNAVLQNTFATIQKYHIPCSINLSLRDINNKKTMKHFFQLLEHFEYNELLTVELLETEDFQDYETVYNFCLQVRSYGVTIALDDFGAGYSNFSHILNLPVDFIKIDASLISNIDKNIHSQLMVETIVSLAQKLQIQTIAEFVASKEILKMVQKLGVDYAQGFHLGKPLRIEAYMQQAD